ncbi:MAG: fibronectin type III domain-containing protein [Flavobacteriales bacterium]
MKSIKVGLDGLSALDKVAKALYIEGKMGPNPAFPTPQPPIADITAARQTLELRIAEALNGGKDATFKKHQAEDVLDELIVQEAGYVLSIAGGDEALILSAGFEVRKQASPVGALKAPANLRADLTDQQGQIKAVWDRVNGSHEYEVQRCDADPSTGEWKLLGLTTRSRYLDEGLESGSVHWYRVRAHGTAGDSPFSDPAKAMAR